MRSLRVIILAIVVAGCGALTTTEIHAERLYFSAESSGGCAQIGPNCVLVEVYGDGRVRAFRIGGADPTAVDTGTIDPELVASLVAEAERTDMQALYEDLPPGECRGCYDGIDTTMTFFAGPAATFSSVDVELDASEPIFDLAWQVHRAAQAAVEVPTVAR